MTFEIIENTPVEIDLQRLLRALGSAESAQRFREEAIWSIETVASVSKPRLLVDYFKVRIKPPDALCVFSENDSKLAELAIGARGVELMGEARMAQVNFATLGQDVQNLGEELQQQGETLKRYILDVAAVLTLEQVGRHANRLAEDRANACGWGVGRRISPGDLNDWSVAEQTLLGTLMPVEDIGISVRESGLMVPLKSTSGLIGLGPDYSDSKVGTICRWCQKQNNCLIFLSRKGSHMTDISHR